MLQMAGLHVDTLKVKFLQIALEEDYKFFNTISWRDEWKPDDSTWAANEFASINKEGEVVGYFKYRINRDTGNIDGLQIANFKKDVLSRTFGQDLQQIFQDIFLRFNFRKINFSVIVGNPAEAFYDKYIEKIGGNIVSYYKDECKLIDGQYYDLKVYEVMKEDFIQAYKKDQS